LNTGKASEESEIDNACLRLYEDLTELNVANVKIKDGGKSGKEIVFNCIQTHAGKSESISDCPLWLFDNRRPGQC
jgi:hypothetical protein